jgi:hypothetical protein
MSTIVTRAGKGSPLTHVEVDANFTNLNTDKVEKTAADITGGTINGTTIGATTPSTVNATTITGQTARLNGTGQNLLLQSQFASNWTATRASASINSAVAPDSTLTALTLTSDGTSGAHIIQPASSATTPAGQTRTASVFAKAGTNNFIQIAFGADGTPFANFDLSGGTVGSNASVTASIVNFGNGWYRCIATTTSLTATDARFFIISSGTSVRGESNSLATTVLLWGAQLEFASSANTYIPTTSAAVYGTPTLSFSGVSTIGLESNGALFVQPAGTGALQAQQTDSTTAGGNARGANAVDWQTTRNNAAQVASGSQSTVGGGGNNRATSTYATASGGNNNTSSGFGSVIAGGNTNTSSGSYSFVGSGESNTASNYSAAVVSGRSNTAAGYLNFIGGGFTNAGTSGSAVTTQSGTMNGTTAVTLSGSNANIKVGQLITGTSINASPHTYVAAISGTSLTLSQNASGSSTSTLSFFTPHGVVVGGGNNQATGAYSAILGGGDAGTAANRNVASGDYSAVVGGRNNTASGIGSFIGGGGFDGTSAQANTASGITSVLCGGQSNTSSGTGSVVGGGVINVANTTGATVVGGYQNTANSGMGTVVGGRYGNTRSITGYLVFPAQNGAITGSGGVSQSAMLIVGKQTTDATATALTCDGTAAGTTNQVILPNNSAYLFKATVISNVTGGGNTSAWKLEGAIKRGANAASTTIVGLVTTTLLAQDAGAATWAIAATADTTNGGLRITFTGQASTTIRTVCKVETTEVTF